jgi:excisionase family DNA binding protein
MFDERPHYAPTMSEPGLGLLWLDDETRRHLSRAIGHYIEQRKRNALGVPRGLTQLFVSLGDSSRRQPTEWPGEPAISESMCVKYSTAARLLDVSTRTIERLVAAGELVPLKVGRRRVIPVFQLRQRIDQEVA